MPHILAASPSRKRKPIQLDLHTPAFIGGQARRRGLSRRAPIQNVTFSQTQETNLNKLFFATVSIGTPPQAINVTIDLISSDLIIPSNVTYCPGCGFIPAQSSSASNESSTNVFHRDNDQPNAIPIEGSIFIDNLAIQNIQVPVIQFLVANDIDGGIPSGYEHGFLGLGGQTLSTLDTSPPWQSLLGSNNLPLEFGLWLSRNGTGRAGSFFLGGHDASVYSGAIDFLPVTGQANTFWNLNVTGLTSQGSAIAIPAGGQIAQFDLNNPGILAPQAIVDAFWAKVPNATTNGGGGSYIFPCGSNVDFSITFGGRSWSIPSGDMALEDLGGGDCLGSLSGHTSTTETQWVIGFQFLKSYYTAYQTSPAMIGIADLSTLAGGSGEPNSTAPIPTTSSSLPTGTGGSSVHESSPASSPGALVSKNSVNAAAIAGGIIGALALIGALFLVWFFVRRRYRRPGESWETADLGTSFSPQENTMVSPFSSPLTARTLVANHGSGKVLPGAPYGASVSAQYFVPAAGSNNSSSGSGSTPPSSDEKRTLATLATRSTSLRQQPFSPSQSSNATSPSSASASRSGRAPSVARSQQETAALRNELQHLREEVQHWQAVAETAPPPSYNEEVREDGRF